MQGHVDGVVRQTFLAITAGDLCSQPWCRPGTRLTLRIGILMRTGSFVFEGAGWASSMSLLSSAFSSLVVLLDGLVQDRAGYRAGLLEHGWSGRCRRTSSA